MAYTFKDFIHDDITWCAELSCPRKDCFRNQVNMRQKEGLFSMANFKYTSECKLLCDNLCIWAQVDNGDLMCTNYDCPACADYCPKEGEYSKILSCKYEQIAEDIKK